MILALFARLGVREAEGFDHIHGLVEATKRALARARPRRHRSELSARIRSSACSTTAIIAGEAMKIDRNKAARWPLAAGAGDTIWMGAADSSGLVVSYIQSLYWEFGSGCVLPATGVLMQNRGASFSLDAGALNYLRARAAAVPHAQSGARRAQRRPRHGLWLHGRRRPAADAKRAVHPLRRFPRAALRRDRPAALGARPHLGRAAHRAAARAALRRQSDRPLAAAGHDVEVLSEPYSDVMGHAGAVGAASGRQPAKAPTIRARMAARRGCNPARS